MVAARTFADGRYSAVAFGGCIGTYPRSGAQETMLLKNLIRPQFQPSCAIPNDGSRGTGPDALSNASDRLEECGLLFRGSVRGLIRPKGRSLMYPGSGIPLIVRH